MVIVLIQNTILKQLKLCGVIPLVNDGTRFSLSQAGPGKYRRSQIKIVTSCFQLSCWLTNTNAVMIGGVKMPKVVCHSYRVLSSVVKKNISLRHTGVFRRDCSVYTRQCRRLSSPSRTLASASCLQRPHVLTYSVDTRRCFSDGYSETTEETQQVESESKISSQSKLALLFLQALVLSLLQ